MLHFSCKLDDYITALAWSIVPDRLHPTLAISSASGEIKLWQGTDALTTLQEITQSSIDSLSVSGDGRYLAAGGQDGRVKIWDLDTQELIQTLDNGSVWIDRLSWHPQYNLLAFGVGRRVCIWDAENQKSLIWLNFADSSVLDLDWNPQTKLLAVAGYCGVKVWDGDDWEAEPTELELLTASIAVAWSPNAKFIAYGNLDNTLAINEWGNDNPWIMQGFPGKVRTLSWSEPESVLGAPLIAASSIEGVVVWEKQAGDEGIWDAWILEGHQDTVNTIDFAPNSFLLASAADDGRLCLWRDAENLSWILDGVKEGFSALAWHPQGDFLAAGGNCGEVFVWDDRLIKLAKETGQQTKENISY
jgi:WD40 repeat protein